MNLIQAFWANTAPAAEFPEQFDGGQWFELLGCCSPSSPLPLKQKYLRQLRKVTAELFGILNQISGHVLQ